MQLNLGWGWHLEDVAFVEAAIELCDGRPSDVERVGIQFGGRRFCPWSAIVIRIDENLIQEIRQRKQVYSDAADRLVRALSRAVVWGSVRISSKTASSL